MFAKSYGKAKEPRRAYVLAFAIGVGFILIGIYIKHHKLIRKFYIIRLLTSFIIYTTGQVGLVVGSWPSNRATEGSNPK